MGSARCSRAGRSTHGVNVVIIVVGAFVVVRAANLAIEHLQFKLGTAARDDRPRMAAARRDARRHPHQPGHGRRSAFVAILMLLRELSIDVVPILTGAGIAGLAIGFGAQNLVRDVISGFFLILEDQVRVGDLARINGVAGTVEQINLRTIVLRDGEGAVQVFPNGTITALANLSKQFAYAVVDVRVAYSENIDRVMGTIREVGASMEQRPGVGAAASWRRSRSSASNRWPTAPRPIRVKFKTQPLNQGKVANELRRRLMGAFVGRGIRPYSG